MSKYIDAEKLIALLEQRKKQLALWVDKEYANQRIDEIDCIIDVDIDSLQQEQPEDLASLINEATSVAKRIVDRNSFYNSLPQNLRNKYTSEAWREILEALSIMKKQEQSEVDLERDTVQFCFDKGLNVTPYQAKTIAVTSTNSAKTVNDMDKPLIALLDSCKTAIIKKDIVTLISSAKSLGLDSKFRSPLLDFIKNLIIEDIKDFMIKNKRNSIKINRKDIYHQETFDWYSLKDGELFRNGHKTFYDSMGKLYVAYKYIHETNLVSD